MNSITDLANLISEDIHENNGLTGLILEYNLKDIKDAMNVIDREDIRRPFEDILKDDKLFMSFIEKIRNKFIEQFGGIKPFKTSGHGVDDKLLGILKALAKEGLAARIKNPLTPHYRPIAAMDRDRAKTKY